MSQVGVYEAKTRFSQLLNRVAQGERIIITRHGTPVAELVPVKTFSREQVREAVKALRAFREKHSLGDLSIRELIDEGRRW